MSSSRACAMPPISTAAASNEFLTRVLAAATDPELTDDESLRVRERLAAAGLLASAGPPRPRPAEDDLTLARHRAGQGHQLADLVRDSRE